MGLFDIPDPVSMFESAKNAGLERESANALVSATCSAWISLMWQLGNARWAQFIGMGQGLKDAATSMYLSLHALELKNFLSLTVPKDLLDGKNLSRFQTEQKG